MRSTDDCGACGHACDALCVSAACRLPVAIAAGPRHACALTDAGEVLCWGLNSGGAVSIDRPDAIVRVPALVALPGPAVEIHVTDAASFARLADGTIVSWGYAALGRTSTGRGPAPLEAPADAIAFDARAYNGCLVHTNGHVACWGRVQVPTDVPDLIDVVDVAVGSDFACVRHLDGGVSCWGSDSNGQLGDGRTSDRPTPERIVGLADVVTLEAGDAHACAVTAEGAALCWGRNESGQLGIGTTVTARRPTAVAGLTGIVDASAGAAHTCFVLVDRTLRCAGSNVSGQLGAGPTLTSTPWASFAPPITDVLVVEAGAQTLFVIDGAHASRACGLASSGQLTLPSTPSVVFGLTSLAWD
jgi:alpha-tubulin suppressor-like RCC1 family protein